MTAAPRVPVGPPGSSSARGYQPLAMWVVYRHPKDDPEAFVARRWEMGLTGMAPTMVVMRDGALEPLQLAMRARGLFRLERDPRDDPVIVEVWL